MYLLFRKKTLPLNNLKTRTVKNAEISVFVVLKWVSICYYMIYMTVFLKSTWSAIRQKRKSQKQVLQESKTRQIFRKNEQFQLPDTLIYVCVSGAKKCSFFGNLVCFVFLWRPFWDSSFCLITDELGPFYPQTLTKDLYCKKKLSLNFFPLGLYEQLQNGVLWKNISPIYFVQVYSGVQAYSGLSKYMW